MANPNPNISGLRRGGGESRRGIPNKSSRAMKAFLTSVFDEVLAREEFKAKLVEQITTLTIDTRLLALLLAYWVGRPAVAVDHRHDTLSLAELICGQVPKATEDDEDYDPGLPEPPWRQ